MVIDRELIGKIVSSKGTLSQRQLELVSKWLPKQLNYKENVYFYLRGRECSEERAKQLVRERQWLNSERKDAKNRNKNARKRDGRRLSNIQIHKAKNILKVGAITEWERTFLKSVVAKGCNLTSKQQECFSKICEKS